MVVCMGDLLLFHRREQPAKLLIIILTLKLLMLLEMEFLSYAFLLILFLLLGEVVTVRTCLLLLDYGSVINYKVSFGSSGHDQTLFVARSFSGNDILFTAIMISRHSGSFSLINCQAARIHLQQDINAILLSGNHPLILLDHGR